MRRSSTAARRSPTVAILGAGITGLTAAAFLRKQGIEDFTVFEENGDGVGGTWRDHDYPGAGTDTEVPSYLPTFLPRPNFHSQFARRDEILSYCEMVAAEYVGLEKFRFGCRVIALRFGGDEWTLDTSQGRFHAAFIIFCTASISAKFVRRPNGIANEASFGGVIRHSSECGSDLAEYKGKRILIVGCGATAVQLAPTVAPVARSVTVLRRTMPYMTVRSKVALPQRAWLYTLWRWVYELRNDFITLFDGARCIEFVLRWWVWLRDYMFRAPLPAACQPSPGQPVQCTRRAFDYLGFRSAVIDGRISVVDGQADPLRAYTPDGVVLASGRELRADLVVLATGYEIGKVDISFYVEGALRDQAEASRFPNFFYPLAGAPLFTIPPRVCEDNMLYFVRVLRSYSAHPVLFFPPEDQPSFRKDYSILFSPHCSSRRYLLHDRKDAPRYRTDDLQVQGIPVPRAFARWVLWWQRPREWRPKGAGEEEGDAAITAGPSSNAAMQCLAMCDGFWNRCSGVSWRQMEMV